ncbi:MAG: ATP synthase F1 subunit delta [Alicyclobacillus herbarius]|uniref:ATP synthase F1 subunit delta n=1 Tax=Alicyclobacillus herbarius TaxID=122960 RepID=UPI0003F802EA|nr:ATP synthase F1 subunit delta [Alicyclobacillus herbarius]MCL6633001.1 ATP synthase F1 subunit delta [Alicyclobacillus herbarius]
MLSGVVTNRYTRGLFEVAKRNNALERVDQGLTLVSALLKANDGLKTMVEHPLISAEDKLKVISNILNDMANSSLLGRLKNLFKDPVHPLVLQFLGVLFSRNRSEYITAVAEEFHELVEAEKGRVRVDVETALPLSEQEQKELSQKLGAALGREVNAHMEVNPDLIAGYRFRLGNRVIDATVKGALAQFDERLLAGAAGKEGTL